MWQNLLRWTIDRFRRCGTKDSNAAKISRHEFALFAVASLGFVYRHDALTSSDSPLKWTQMFARGKRPPGIQWKGWFLRKLTARQKLRHFRRARHQMRRHVVRVPGKLSVLRAAAKERFDAAKRALPSALVLYDQRPGCCVLRPPANFDWTCNGFVPVTYLITPPWPRMRAG